MNSTTYGFREFGTTILIPLALTASCRPAAAQQPEITFTWPAIIECAHDDIGDMPAMQDGQPEGAWSPAQIAWAHSMKQIRDCQTMLAARHEGWVDGRAGKPDLFDPTQERETVEPKTEEQ